MVESCGSVDLFFTASRGRSWTDLFSFGGWHDLQQPTTYTAIKDETYDLQGSRMHVWVELGGSSLISFSLIPKISP